jgi:transcriptional activator for dhaKLM operon
MQKSHYFHDDVFDAWSEFRYRRNAVAIAPAHNIRPIIYDSWVRCQNLFTIQQHQHPKIPDAPSPITLVSASLPYLEDIYQHMEGEPCAVFLADAVGKVLAIEGDLMHTGTEQQIGLAVGERWSEAVIGTNAVALALQHAMPVQVRGAEHYLQIFHQYADSAALIHDDQGAIIGAVGLITLLSRADPTQLALVMATARAITAQLQTEMMLEQANRRLRQLNYIMESVTDGVITWDTQGVIDHINDKACQILSLASQTMLGRSIHDTIQFSEHIRSVIDQQGELSNVEDPIRVFDRIVRCLISIRVIKAGNRQVVGGIAMLRTLSQVRSWVNQQTSTLSSMTFDNFQFQSAQMNEVVRQAEVAARGALPVLIHGENGIGKTTLVQAIHNAGPRQTKPLVVVNCGMVPNEFMVEELLGKEADHQQLGRPSKFELADGGTLLFDHIEQLSLEAQQILLSVMNSRSVTRLQGHRTNYVNVRIIATTAEDIGELTRMGGFLPQLYYLFNVFTLHVAPLRERREDIVQLANYFLQRASTPGATYHMQPEVHEVLWRYPWPGNVRELENVIERVVMQTNGPTVHLMDLPENIRAPQSLCPDSLIPQQVVSLQDAEREAIIRAGWAHQGNVTDMAASLGINRTTLWRKFKQYGLQADDFKSG